MKQKTILIEKRAGIDTALGELENRLSYCRRALETGSEKVLRDKARQLQKNKEIENNEVKSDEV